MRPGRLIPYIAVALLAGHGAATVAQENSNLRREIDHLGFQIDEAIRPVCRPSPLNLFGPAQIVRGYRIPGVGIVFVVPPRSLPGERTARLRDALANRATAQNALAGPQPRRAATRVAANAGSPPPRRPPGAARLSREEQADLALRAFEEQVRTMDEAAARMHQDVQLALAEMMREVHNPGSRVASTEQAGAQAEVPALPPLPPWSEWWGFEAPPDPRSAREIMNETRAAISRTLASAGLTGLPPDETIIVTVEFFVEDTLDLAAPPTTTLVTRVRGRDLSAHRRGTLATDAFLQRVESSEF